MNRDDHLGNKVLPLLEINGRLGVDAIATLLNEKPRSVATALIFLHRIGLARPVFTDDIVKRRSGKKQRAVFWEIGDSKNRPPMPNRGGDNKGKRHDVAVVTVGVDDADLEWMERYRQQRQQRMARS